IPDAVHGQEINPLSDPEGEDIIECQARVDVPDEPICRYRGTVAEFIRYAAGEPVNPIDRPELTGFSTSQPN
ncbi:hypothetical protein, partial [Paludisphaera rhizosphaerae]|uniref:hypothetical protein n=1 Tax=Paludisphaera rhizosphaerae TaxID=2711216 RepID=UPI001981422A